MRILILTAFCAFINLGYTQDSTQVKEGVLIVNYEPRMYRSTIDPALMQSNGLSYDELREQMRKGFDDNLYLECKAQGHVVSLMREDTSLYDGKVAQLHSQISYKYVAMETENPANPEQKEDKPLDKLGNKLDKLFTKKKATSEEEDRMGTWVEDGQVKSRIDNREKYMNTHIHQPRLVKNLCSDYGVNKVIFINQLDIFETTGQYEDTRKIKVHYTIFDQYGKEINSGAEYTYFKQAENRLKVITGEKFYPVCHAIASKL